MQRLMTLSYQGMTRFESDCHGTATRVIRGSDAATGSRTSDRSFPRPSLARTSRTQGPTSPLRPGRLDLDPGRLPLAPLVAGSSSVPGCRPT